MNVELLQTRLAVFDLDGTLIDAFQDIADAANYVLRANGRPEMSVDEVKQFVGKGARILVEGILGTDNSEIVEPNYGLLVAYYEAATETRATFYPGMLDAIARLRAAGVKTAVVSNKPHPVTEKVMKVLGAVESFDFILGESPRFPRKPAPAMLHHVMEEAGASPGQTVMIGDSAVDADFARAAGVRMIGVSWGQLSAEQLRVAGVLEIVRDARELPSLILES